MRKTSYEMAMEILKSLEGKKKEALKKALDRNNYLTSARLLEHGKIRTYKEGWYLQLYGTRCSFSVFAKDNDGELEILDRKPNEKRLSFIWEDSLRFNEIDFDNIR